MGEEILISSDIWIGSSGSQKTVPSASLILSIPKKPGVIFFLNLVSIGQLNIDCNLSLEFCGKRWLLRIVGKHNMDSLKS